MNIFRKITLMAASLASMMTGADAAIPSGYYDQCEGKTGEALLTALYQTITNHTTVSYSGLWDLYKTSDVDENGKIWDMYSTKRWTPGNDQCGTYKVIGDCYNREHSFPKSWFNDASPMVSDAFHIYPTDGKVNGQRSNYPFGECSGGTYVASSGNVKALGRLGKCTFSGYSGTVFEPDDQYKGDFARSYFYMAACYNNRISSWSSDMLAGNSYPAFKTWAVNLLLKWTRSDEVSKKELDRQEAVYARQKNRNPFIDHPELAEYIWGNKKGTAWYSTASAQDPELIKPVQGTVIDLGYAAVNRQRSVSVTVQGRYATSSVSLYTSGAGYSVTPSTLTADQFNSGYNVTVSYTGSTAGDAEGILTITDYNTIESEFDLTTVIEDGLPIYDATNVSTDAFTVQWLYLNDQSTYTLHVLQGSTEIAGYPKSVTASAESYTVTGVEPNTAYTYYLTSGSLTSSVKSVTTPEVQPSIFVVSDNLEFNAAPGEASEAALILIEAENISGDITVKVNAPFQLSTDKTNWSTTLTLSPDEDSFYLRMLGQDEGTYGTALTFTAGSYTNDETEATGVISSTPQPGESVIETFNVDETVQKANEPYKSTTFQGTAFQWTLNNAGIGNLTQDLALSGSYAIRFGKNSTSSLTMAEDKADGIGSVTFEAAKWSGDDDATFAVEYSTDGGTSWAQAGLITLTATQNESDKTQFVNSVDVKKTGNVRIRFRQTSGGRWLLDNVEMTAYTGVTAIESVTVSDWDAFCRAGKLVIESATDALPVAVYGMDGLTWYSGKVAAGETVVNLSTGLYIVVSGDRARRVLVK